MIRIAYLFILFVLFGCTDEVFIDRTPVNEGEAVRLQIYFNVPNQQVVDTRQRAVLDDAYINPESLYLLVFDSDDKLVELDRAVSYGADGNVQYYANLTSTNQERRIYIVANSSTVLESKKNSWISGSTTLDKVKSDLLKAPLPVSGTIISAMPHPHPMVGSIVLPVISASTSIGTANSKIQLTRATAKVKIVSNIPAGNTDVQLIGANLVNAPLQGYVFSDVTSPVNIIRLNYGTSDSKEEGMLGVENGGTINLYSYESDAVSQNNTYVILKASYKNTTGYFRINLLDSSGKQLNLKRNYEYQILVNKIGSAGYRTVAEAMKNPPLTGIDFDLTVIDPDSHDIVSNGQYYLGVSNSELIVYKEGDLIDLPVAIVTHNAPSSVSSGSVSVVSGGITIRTASLLSTPGNTVGKELKVNMPAAVKQATIRLNLGSLVKTLTITRRSPVPEPGGVLADFVLPEFVSGYVDSAEDNWLRLSMEGADISGDQDHLVNPAGGIYIHALPNVGFENEVKDRDGVLYFMRANEDGRVKVLLQQKKLDIYRDKVQIKPNTYVATFHRWYQTGERVIRIQPDIAKSTSKWVAVVVEGQDWIELSAARSPDQGLTDHPYGVGDYSSWTDTDIERNTQLKTDSMTVSGIGEKIYFRIGLKSKLPGGESGQPRYGLVAIIHDKGNHFIFVRQGEQADFLMRKTDPVTKDPAYNNPTFSNRNLVVPVSPYNLTDPLRQSGTVDRGTNGYSFVTYPSRVGYYFQGASTHAYSPDINPVDYRPLTAESSFNENWDKKKETCPPGYRRFRDGDDSYFISHSSALVANSEVRQSLWLYPRDGGGSQVNLQNVVRGYIADGFFDRQTISVVQNQQNEPNRPTMAGSGDELAFGGSLFFNPHNNASIFLPEGGAVSDGAGVSQGYFRSRGENGSYWTSSSLSASVGWSFQIGWAFAGFPSYFSEVADNYQQNVGVGANIRCVQLNITRK